MVVALRFVVAEAAVQIFVIVVINQVIWLATVQKINNNSVEVVVLIKVATGKILIKQQKKHQQPQNTHEHSNVILLQITNKNCFFF